MREKKKCAADFKLETIWRCFVACVKLSYVARYPKAEGQGVYKQSYSLEDGFLWRQASWELGDRNAFVLLMLISCTASPPLPSSCATLNLTVNVSIAHTYYTYPPSLRVDVTVRTLFHSNG